MKHSLGNAKASSSARDLHRRGLTVYRQIIDQVRAVSAGTLAAGDQLPAFVRQLALTCHQSQHGSAGLPRA